MKKYPFCRLAVENISKIRGIIHSTYLKKNENGLSTEPAITYLYMITFDQNKWYKLSFPFHIIALTYLLCQIDFLAGSVCDKLRSRIKNLRERVGMDFSTNKNFQIGKSICYSFVCSVNSALFWSSHLIWSNIWNAFSLSRRNIYDFCLIKWIYLVLILILYKFHLIWRVDHVYPK
jgi:hypothetical protein